MMGSGICILLFWGVENDEDNDGCRFEKKKKGKLEKKNCHLTSVERKSDDKARDACGGASDKVERWIEWERVSCRRSHQPE
jgi:hypothetical protein